MSVFRQTRSEPGRKTLAVNKNGNATSKQQPTMGERDFVGNIEELVAKSSILHITREMIKVGEEN